MGVSRIGRPLPVDGLIPANLAKNRQVTNTSMSTSGPTAISA